MALFEHVQTTLHATSLNAPADDQQVLLDSSLLQLSAREREVLNLLVEGKSNTDIAELLVISAKTVSTHRTNIMQKLGANSLADLVRLAAEIMG
ncbi:MAG: helix-turn-helix transcriptional regulator [Anaerolineae bacterium]|nr:helix-turn-helix transcriptional regulator [Anaerolineae bacterium]